MIDNLNIDKGIRRRSRYPGSHPFTIEYRSVFKGRDAEIDELDKVVHVNKLTVLYGKSGHGKSSLINVGLVPTYEEKGYEAIFVRFFSHSHDKPKDLYAIFNAAISEKLEKMNKDAAAGVTGANFLGDIQHSNISLWQNFKQLEWYSRRKAGILLILDQFEEVFTYPEGLESFAKGFSELLFNRIPDEFQQKLQETINQKPEFIKEHLEQLQLIEQPNPIRIVIGIRSDKISLLDKLSTFIPNILKNCFELLPLNIAKARDAITLPAQADGDFSSPKFYYSKEALEEILDFLTQKSSKPIESFQLQIICRDFEERITRIGTENQELTPVGWDKLSTIFQDYYRNIVMGKDRAGATRFTPLEQLLARYLIEKRLIDNRNKVRISLDKNFVDQTGVTPEILEKLVDSRLIRREPNAVSGLSYELSHDTLIDPIVQAVSSGYLPNLDQLCDDFFEQLLSEKLGTPDLSIYKAKVEGMFLDQQGNQTTLHEKEKFAVQMGIGIEEFPIFYFEPSIGAYDIQAVFIPTLIRNRNKRIEQESILQRQAVSEAQEETIKEKALKKQAYFLAAVSLVLAFVAIGFIGFSIFQSKKLEETNRKLAESEAANQAKLDLIKGYNDANEFYEKGKGYVNKPLYRNAMLKFYESAYSQGSSIPESYRQDTTVQRIMREINNKLVLLKTSL